MDYTNLKSRLRSKLFESSNSFALKLHSCSEYPRVLENFRLYHNLLNLNLLGEQCV